MFDKECIWILLGLLCHFPFARGVVIQINHRGSGVLWGNETELTCSFTTATEENVISVLTLVISAKNATTTTFEQIAHFVSPTYTGLTTGGKYLLGRVTLNSSITSSVGQLKISFQYLTCDDEKEYKCLLTLSTPDGELKRESETTNISVQARPLQPVTVSEINSTKLFAENTNVTFICAGNVGKPPSQYFWQKIQRNNVTTKEYNVTTILAEASDSCTYNGTSNLTITMNVEDNHAIMRCAVHSMPDVYKDSEPLNVLYKVRKPAITKNPNAESYLFGSVNITLTCRADGNPQSSYIWYKDDNRAQKLGFNSSLIIETANISKSGTYICQAFNSFGGNTYYQNDSVNISIVYTIPVSTAATENPAPCYFWDICTISLFAVVGTTGGIAIIVGVFVRSCRKKSQRKSVNMNKSSGEKNGSNSASINREYGVTDNLCMSTIKTSDVHETLKYVEVETFENEKTEITDDKKPVQEIAVNKRPTETVYSIVQKTNSVGTPNDRLCTEKSNGLQRDEDDPYADNNELYDHLGNRRHKTNTAGELFDHQQRSPEAGNSKKF